VRQTDRELEQRARENQELQAIIDAQDITPADVERMMSAKQTLEQSLQLLCEQRDSIQKEVWTRYIHMPHSDRHFSRL
jgi:SMC interacting uncharacterized protein involved in chromosome segregation